MSETRRRTFTVAEVADATGVSRPAVYRSIREGSLRALTFAGRLVVPASELERALTPAIERDLAELPTPWPLLRLKPTRVKDEDLDFLANFVAADRAAYEQNAVQKASPTPGEPEVHPTFQHASEAASEAAQEVRRG